MKILFTFSITFKKKLQNDFSKISNKIILDKFSEDFKESGIGKFDRLNETSLYTRTNFFKIKRGGNFNRWVAVRSSHLEIINTPKCKLIKFKIDLTWSYLFAFVVFLILWADENVKVGYLAFLIMSFVNLILIFTQHFISFRDNIDEIILDFESQKHK